MYKVIHYFEDLQDFNYKYKVGDVFPRLGAKVSDARIRELSSNANRQGKALIEEVVEEVSLGKKEDYTKTDIKRMSTSDLKELAISMEIENADDLSGSDLKKMLIEKLGL